MGILWFTKLWVKDVILTAQGLQTLLGPAYIAFGMFSGLSGLYLFIILIKKYLTSKSFLKMQLRYIFVGLFLYVVFTLLVDVIIPLATGHSEYFWISPVFSLFFVISTIYAITRYRLMDVRLILQRSSVFILALSVVVGLTISAIWLMAYLMNYSPNPALMIGGAVAMALTIMLFVPLRSCFQKLADKLFFRKIISYQQALKEVSGRLAVIIDLDELAELIIETTKKAIGLDRAGVLLRDAKTKEYYIQKVVGFQEENGISLVKDNFLTEHLQKSKKPLVYEELQMMIKDAKGRESEEQFKKLKSNMEKIEAILCLPLIVKEKLEGIIVLGRKLSGDAYTKEDLELLETLANQTSVGIENARLYDQVKDFSKHLQEKVDEQTKDMKKLLEIKTDFLHIVSHQLRTPLTGIQGAVAMMTVAETPEERKSLIKDAETSIARLTSITNDMLEALEIEGGRLVIEYDPTDIEKMIEEIIQTLKPNYDKKGLYLKFIKPKQRPIRRVLVDPKYIQMVLTNLIDNAEKYTKEGGVEIILKQPDWKQIKIIVKDTGIGLDDDDKKKLFEKFLRGELASKMHVSGSGLGLFIAKGIIDRHRGKIEAESEGRNKGAEFIVTLPTTTAY